MASSYSDTIDGLWNVIPQIFRLIGTQNDTLKQQAEQIEKLEKKLEDTNYLVNIVIDIQSNSHRREDRLQEDIVELEEFIEELSNELKITHDSDILPEDDEDVTLFSDTGSITCVLSERCDYAEYLDNVECMRAELDELEEDIERMKEELVKYNELTTLLEFLKYRSKNKKSEQS